MSLDLYGPKMILIIASDFSEVRTLYGCAIEKKDDNTFPSILKIQPKHNLFNK